MEVGDCHVLADVRAGSVNTRCLASDGGLASGGGLQGWPQLSHPGEWTGSREWRRPCVGPRWSWERRQVHEDAAHYRLLSASHQLIWSSREGPFCSDLLGHPHCPGSQTSFLSRQRWGAHGQKPGLTGLQRSGSQALASQTGRRVGAESMPERGMQASCLLSAGGRAGSWR